MQAFQAFQWVMQPSSAPAVWVLACAIAAQYLTPLLRTADGPSRLPTVETECCDCEKFNYEKVKKETEDSLKRSEQRLAEKLSTKQWEELLGQLWAGLLGAVPGCLAWAVSVTKTLCRWIRGNGARGRHRRARRAQARAAESSETASSATSGELEAARSRASSLR